MFTPEYIENLIQESIKAATKCLEENRAKDAINLLKHLATFFTQERSDVLQLLGLAFHKDTQYSEAIEVFQKVLQAEPNNSENHNNIALCYGCLEQIEKAIEHLNKAIQINPKNPIFYSNLGHQYRQIDDYDSALAAYKQAAFMAPTDPLILYNVGGCYMEMLEPEKAIEYFKLANSDAAKVGMAYAYQLLGDWWNAGLYYECRLDYFKAAKYFKIHYDSDKLWKGQPLDGKTIVLYCEQGMGDIIQSLRFVPILRCNVIIEAPEIMRSLLEENGYNVVLDGSKVEHDYHCSIMSLQHWLDNVSVTPNLKTSRSADLGYPDMFKIGICWAGNPQHPQDKDRSMHLKNFKRLHDIPGVKLFSLQKDIRPRIWPPSNRVIDLTVGAADMKVVDMAPYMNSFQDTAAIINSLDLVITVDTAILHLAGSMQKPVWSMLAWEGDTRWGLPWQEWNWYTSNTIFRQKSRGDWNSVFQAMAKKIVEQLDLPAV